MRSLVLLFLVAACAHETTGIELPRVVRAHLGITYARAARWERPVLVDERETGKRGAACEQPDQGFHRDTAEDCLDLNIWAPSDAKRAPVFVWIHGGAFTGGSGSDELYDGARLARRTGLVVVNINYRLGAFGFLSFRQHPIPALGLLDQRAALQWVQQHIAAYGGDPANVTIAGESAGGWSVCSQLAMPASRGLFAKALVMSGGCSDALYQSADEAAELGDQLLKALDCADLECARAKPAEAIANALHFRKGLLLPPGVWWGPIVDGTELPRVPLAAIRDGDFARVPLLIGTARDEGTLHTYFYDTVTPDQLAWFVRTTFGAAAEAPVLARYARPTPKAALTDIVSEGIFRCNARRVARLVAPHAAVYLYEWTHALDGPPKVHALGPTHGVDLTFLFGATTEGIGPSAREEALVDEVQDRFGAFARSGDPGHGWPRYGASDEHAVLDLPVSRGAHLDRDICDQWDAISRY